MPAPPMALQRHVLGGLAGVGAACALARLATHLLARALGHVFPLLGLVVAGRLAGARVARGAAVVLSRLRHAVTLLLRLALLVLGARGLREAERDHARD